MKSLILSVATLLLPGALACDNPSSDACAAAVSSSAAQLVSFCASYTASDVTATTGLPTGIASACSYSSRHVSSACSCFVTGGATTASTTITTTPSSTVSTKTTTTTATGVGSTCIVTAYASISSAVKSCTNIVLSNISAPPSSTISLKLQTSATVTFAGDTTFGYTPDDSFDPIIIEGNYALVTGAPGHVIDGNGPAYWDGQGSNGGTKKPDHFIVVKDSTDLTISGLNIQNWPVHCFDITGNEGLTITGLTMDNSAGDAPNAASSGLPAAHNSDGFDISSSDYVTLDNIWVHNQDDCVAVTSGTQINVTNMYCYGGHGLSIGSIGGKSNNTVNGVTFSNSQIVNSQNGCRIKTNSGTTGTVNNVTYRNITLSGISIYGIDVQQDYLNGGPTGKPTNGVDVTNISFIGVTGTCNTTADNYYILCGDGSCSNFTFTGVEITGGSNSSCNYPASGCP